MLKKSSKVLSVVLLVGMFSASCAMPTTTKVEKKNSRIKILKRITKAVFMDDLLKL
mgnify:CR=1 FL=1